MKKINYMEILDCCGCRKTVQMSNLKEYISKYPNWGEFILKRHHQFLNSIIKHNFVLRNASDDTGYCIKDIESILLRVQSQFEIYERDKNVYFEDLILNYNSLLFEWRPKENTKKEIQYVHTEYKATKEKSKNNINDLIDKKKNITKDKTVISRFNIDTKNAERDNRIIETLEISKDIVNLPEILGDTLYKYTHELLQGLSFDQIAEKHNKTKQYLISTIYGKPKYRYKSEKGLRLILEENEHLIKY